MTNETILIDPEHVAAAYRIEPGRVTSGVSGPTLGRHPGAGRARGRPPQMNDDEIGRRTQDMYNAIAIVTAFYGELDSEDRPTFNAVVEGTLSETDPHTVITGLAMLCTALARDLSMLTHLPVPKQLQAGAEGLMKYGIRRESDDGARE